MNENLFPPDPSQDLRDLQRTVDGVQAAGRSALLEASAGWILRTMTPPAVPSAGDVHIYANGGRLWVRSTSGTFAVEEVPIAPAVANQDPLPTDVTAPGSYSQAWGQRVRDDLVATRAKVFEIQSSLRSAGLMAG